MDGNLIPRLVRKRTDSTIGSLRPRSYNLPRADNQLRGRQACRYSRTGEGRPMETLFYALGLGAVAVVMFSALGLL